MNEHLYVLPEHWRVYEEADGTVCIVPHPRRRRIYGALMLVFAVCVQVMLWGTLPLMRKGWLESSGYFLMMQSFEVCLIYWALMRCFGRREWRVRHNYLEVCNILFRYRRTRRFKSDAIIVQPGRGETGFAWVLFTVYGRNVAPPLFDPFLMADDSLEAVLAVGNLLSRITGWPLREWTK